MNKAIIQPLKKASLQLNQMVEDIQNGNGDLSIRIPVKRMDEIGQLVTGVNLFVEKLQNIMKQLKDGSSDMDEVADKMEQAGWKYRRRDHEYVSCN
ncbi:MAG: HAMP domain-containing protein [Roseburia sp.]